MDLNDLSINPELEIVDFGIVDIVNTSGPEEDETPMFPFIYL